MGVVFVVLAILLVGTSLITRADFFVSRRTAGTDDEEAPPAGSADTGRAGPPPDVVAAISVALAMAEDDAATQRASIGAPPQTPSGQSPWVAAGRRAAMEGGPRLRR
jgi:Na+-transporting methylmalonyl-CoA/oxaloacetate decarboxylase gamma subunit